MEFNEGETFELLAVGDKSGFGCSFEKKLDPAKKKTCCFIHEEREEIRGEKLCGMTVKQPDGCRQPGSSDVRYAKT